MSSKKGWKQFVNSLDLVESETVEGEYAGSFSSSKLCPVILSF